MSSPFAPHPATRSAARDRRDSWNALTGVPFTCGNTHSEHLAAAQALSGGGGRTCGTGGQVTRASPAYGSGAVAQHARDQLRAFVLGGDRGGAERQFP